MIGAHSRSPPRPELHSRPVTLHPLQLTVLAVVGAMFLVYAAVRFFGRNRR